jgi:cytochrome c oxidase subunit 1
MRSATENESRTRMIGLVEEPPRWRGEWTQLLAPTESRALVLGFLGLSITALALAGVFVFLVATARTPLVVLIVGRDYLYTALVAHVTFALNAWLLSFIAVLWSLEAARLGMPIARGCGRLSLGLAWAGLILMAFVPLVGVGQPIMADYLPILLHPLFILGLIAFGSGIGLAALGYLDAVRRSAERAPLEAKALTFCAGGYLAALGVLVLTALHSDRNDYASLVWGAGHLLQLVNAAGLVAAALLLAPQLSRLERWLIELGLSGFAVSMLIVVLASAHSLPWTRVAGSFWIGIALPTVTTWLVLIASWWRSYQREHIQPDQIQFLGIALVLFGVGGFIALLGLGNDTRVTAHYHGVVGAVTIVFMGLAYRVLAEAGLRPAWRTATRLQPYLYGGGLLLVIAGLFWAGEAGTARKVFQAISSDPSLIVAGSLFGLGAIGTVAGGVAFVGSTGITLLAGPDPGRAPVRTGVSAAAGPVSFKVRG